MKDKTTVTLLCLFLGGIGAHHYYMGKIGRGIVYTVFAITLIPAFISLVEFVILASMSENEFHLKYNAAYIDRSEEESRNLDQLSKLHDLKEKGVISQEEFERKKAKLIA